MKEIIKIGSVELTKDNAFKLYQEGKYIVSYRTIYQLMYSQAQKTVYGQKIYYHNNSEHYVGLTKRGRFFAMDGKSVNHLLGYKLVNE